MFFFDPALDLMVTKSGPISLLLPWIPTQKGLVSTSSNFVGEQPSFLMAEFILLNEVLDVSNGQYDETEFFL